MNTKTTKYNNNNNLIPVGYLSSEAIEVTKGNVVKNMGTIRKIKYVGQHEFNLTKDLSYVTSAIEFETLSTLTGRKLYFVVPIDEIVEVMQYADPENYEFDFLPLKSDDSVIYPQNSIFEENLKNLLNELKDE